MVLATILVIIVLGLVIVGIGGLIVLPKPKLYEYKGNVYRVISKAKVKNQVTRKWENSYIYVSVKDDDTVYVREELDFLAKFTRCK